MGLLVRQVSRTRRRKMVCNPLSTREKVTVVSRFPLRRWRGGKSTGQRTCRRVVAFLLNASIWGGGEGEEVRPIIIHNLHFFFLMEISSRAPVPHLRPGLVHCDSASRGDCRRVFSDKSRVSSFFWQFSRLCLDSIVIPPWLRWVKGVCVFRCNLPPALVAEWPGSFTCQRSNTVVKRTLNKS